MKKLTSAVAFAALILASCTNPLERDYREGKKNANAGNFRIAAQLFDQVILRDSESEIAIEAMKEGARLAVLEIKDYKRAAKYYQKIIQHSQKESDREEAQQQLAALYFSSLQDYERAAIEYSKLATSSKIESDRAEHKLMTARSYYYLGNYFQTISEIEEVLKMKSNKETSFQAMLLNGNVLIAQKNFLDASKIFKNIIKSFPEQSLAENVHLVLSLSYEESGDYKRALSTLEDIKSIYEPQEYLELRIKRVQERAKNQPGARGFRK